MTEMWFQIILDIIKLCIFYIYKIFYLFRITLYKTCYYLNLIRKHLNNEKIESLETKMRSLESEKTNLLAQLEETERKLKEETIAKNQNEEIKKKLVRQRIGKSLSFFLSHQKSILFI